MTKNKFTVSLPKTYFWYMLCGTAIFVLLPVPFTIFQGIQHVALYILCSIMSLPFIYYMAKSKLFKISVDDQKITVRNVIGSYSLDVSEIEKVDWKISITNFGQSEKILVKTSSKRFTIETLMEDFDRMSQYISANVDISKIKTHKKNMIKQ
ncbi:hypothetical protein EHE19_009560 [Ruminiclostridium herbifermentans]|uniref:DUF304 domain-containing protein n=1 Tax=Ruminiclostridium herbifermentans TaxID=2488810 RepID=A0A4V6EQ09_9FIRM|nr:hypothetical protein [Ruminiclostridium herbifermentans]QNU68615.1 hypothetical protein EHE19_009560 [Ruminiclostridium herbifermentans]